MGKHKGGNFNLFESYLASGLVASSSTSTDIQPVPLPDSMRVSTLLEQIGQERKWTEQQINQDIQIMDKHRLYYVSDMRELSSSSWKVIELLPLVKDLLRKAIVQKEKKYKEKKMKKRMKKMGKPVTDTSILSGGVISEDPETIRNTIQNLTVESVENDPEDKKTGRKKSVSFSEQDPIMLTQHTNTTMASDSSTSTSTSSSSSSSSDSECDNKQCKPTTTVVNNQRKIFTGRPIKPISPNRIRVQTADGDVFEADRFCPHKKVDLATWGQVMGRSVICTKHNWNFSMDGLSATKGRSLNACKVNDW